MPKKATPLDVAKINALKPRDKPYRVTDGGGLMLEVAPSGAKMWICRLSVLGRRKDFGLGGYPAVSLKQARETARAAKTLAREGIDYGEHRAAKLAAARAARDARADAAREAGDRLFRVVAEQCISALAHGFKSPKTAAQWRASLDMHAMPVLGDRRVDEITRADIMRAIADVWATRPATARKVLRRIGTVLRFAAARNLRPNDNPADIQILRHAGLPALPGGQQRPALPWQSVPGVIKALAMQPGQAALALRFLILTAMRSNEVRGARWNEIDIETATWTIPGARMKSRRSSDQLPHRVPLAPAALDVLAEAMSAAVGATVPIAEMPARARLLGSAVVFPGRGNGPMSDMSISEIVRRLNADRPAGFPPPWRDADGRPAVPHGFRSSFRTWVDDRRPGDADAAEIALAHREKNKVAAAYKRSDLFERRIELMAEWAKHCTGLLENSQKMEGGNAKRRR